MRAKTIKHLSFFAIVTGSILLIPLVAMRFAEEVKWAPSDFVFMGILLFGSGLVYELLSRNVKNPQQRVIIGLIVIALMLFIWVTAATGLWMD